VVHQLHDYYSHLGRPWGRWTLAQEKVHWNSDRRRIGEYTVDSLSLSFLSQITNANRNRETTEFSEHFSFDFIYFSCILPQALFTLGMWCSVLPAMMKPSNNIAQNSSGKIENANLYFFSWGAFFMAISILVGYLHDAHGIGKSMRNQSFKASAWGALMAASFVTMASGT
jgi:hypothetical protein